MASKGTILTMGIVGAAALAGVVALSTCASQSRRSGQGDTPQKSSPTADAQPARSAPSAPPKIDERLTPIMADLADKFEKLGAMSATLKTELASAAGGAGTTEGTGNYEFKMQDGKRLIRVWLSNSLTIAGNDTLYHTAEVVDDIYDGEFLYKHIQQHKLKQVTKRAYVPSAVLQIGGHEVIRQLTGGYDLKWAGEETLGDATTVVIEAAPVGGDWKAKHWFDKQTGIRLRWLETNKRNEKTVDITLSDINLRPEFSEDNFKPKIPPGFKLVDETAPAGPPKP